MKRALFAAMPVGLALLVAGAGWAGLAPRILPAAYVVCLVLGALLTGLGVWARRDMMMREGGGSAVRFGAGALASAGIALAILLLVNFASARYHERWDMTRTKGFSLHPVTARVLEGVEDPVDVYAFVPGNQRLVRRSVDQLYRIFEYEQPNIAVQVVDPNARPDLVEELGVRGTNLTIVQAGERQVVFPGHEEADLAAALVEISRTEPKVIYWVIGHGERRPDEEGGLGYNRLRADLQDEFFQIRTLSLGAGESVPDDASLVVFADPRNPIPREIAEIYDDWMRRGGRMLVLSDVALDQARGETHPLGWLLERWGLRALPAVIVDPRGRTGSQDPRLVVGDVFGQHESVVALAGMRAVFDLARPLEFFESSVDRQVFHHSLVRVGSDLTMSGREPYVETDLTKVRSGMPIDVASQQAWGQKQRHVVLAAYRQYEPVPGLGERGREARLVLTGDADFMTDAHYDREANSELTLNLIRWLTGEELLIRREGEERIAKEAMSLEPQQHNVVVFLVIGSPVVVFLAGWIVWFLRRSK